VEKPTGKIWRTASGKSLFQRRNQQVRAKLLERTFRKSNVSRAGQRSFYERSLKGAARAHFTEQRLIIGPTKVMDFSNDAEENL